MVQTEKKMKTGSKTVKKRETSGCTSKITFWNTEKEKRNNCKLQDRKNKNKEKSPCIKKIPSFSSFPIVMMKMISWNVHSFELSKGIEFLQN
jgi:hypothetical protein